MAGRTPQRRCTGCGRITGKDELVRLALAPKAGPRRAIVIDRQACLGGRGAYVCARERGVPARECLQRALEGGGIVRTLRCGSKIDSSDILKLGSR